MNTTMTAPNGYQITMFKCVEGFGVTYGAQCETNLTAEQALNEFQSCLRHAMECEGMFDE
tara:strand:- start:179 stop:358 length:180 start_codon:yes stop_codon:yes gene_type:complete